MAKDTSRYIVTETSPLIEQEADLGHEHHTWPDGTPMTEENTEAYTDKVATEARLNGRPSLTGKPGASPQVAFRISQELRDHAEKVAAREGRTVSAIAREALEEYITQR